jgi:hypothetical protein
MADTGFPATDAEHDFLRLRRRQVLSRLAAWLRREPDDVSEILPFDEVVAALGRLGEHKLGLQLIPLDSIVGSVDRTRDFDRWFRPRSGRGRERWERLARAQRRGESIPPIEVYRIGDLHFVVDGHHRVSVARAREQHSVPAIVRRICTTAYAMWCLRLSHLASKAAEREFLLRVSLPDDTRAELWLDRPADWARLADAAEAWGFRRGLAGIDPRELGQRWWTDEVVPLVARLRASGRGVGLRDIELYAADLADRDRRAGRTPS